MRLLAAYVCAIIIGAIGFLLWPLPIPVERPDAAAPGLVWTFGTYTIVLTEEACPFDDVKNVIETEGIGPASAYRATQSGKTIIGGCWVRDVGGDVMTMTQTGAISSIPLEWFTVPKGKN